ncbi:rRNA maturation RNase YbeY [Ruminococcus sp.]|uniref:rRNA maturation RNase YbeY n=1 Tax=Ruminococcus sp. TaxID=41978 RepID=UPI00388DF3CB
MFMMAMANDKVKVIITDAQKKVRIPTGLRMLVRRACIAVLREENFKGNAEVSVTFVDNEEIRSMNRKFRDIDAATDVLSFPLGENGEYDLNPATGAKLLGDVVISLERARDQAEEFGHSLEREVCYLSVHSMLHLLGYDHMEPQEKAEMRMKEETVMTRIGLERI